MSNTRRVPSGSPTKQNAFCSSIEYDRGLLANLVALRAADLSSEDRDLIFSLQYFSWEKGGLAKVAADLVSSHGGELATRNMQKLGLRPGQIYTASQVKQVRAEIPGGEDEFPLRGEYDALWNLVYDDPMAEYTGESKRRMSAGLEAKIKAAKQPIEYEASRFIERCRSESSQLADYLAMLCLNPEVRIDGPWWFPNLIATLRQYVKVRCQSNRGNIVETEIVRLVNQALDYTLETREMTPIYGDAGLGKSESVKAWVATHPGQARYVQVPGTNDDISFFRRIAEAYGVSSALSLKSTQLRERVERVAQLAGLALVFDEGHNLLCQDYRCRKRPSRISWIITELVNYGVPVVICATPQFEKDKLIIQKRTGWNWDQFDRRIGVPEILPQELSIADMTAVARAHLPEGDASSIKALVGYAIFSKSHLAGIAHIVKRARYAARLEARTKVTIGDIQNAIGKRLPVDPEASTGTAPSVEKPRKTKPVVSRSKVPETIGRGIRPVEPELGQSRLAQEALV